MCRTDPRNGDFSGTALEESAETLLHRQKNVLNHKGTITSIAFHFQKNTENNLLYRVFNMSKINAADAFANPLQRYGKCSILKSTKQSRLIEK